MKKISFLLFIFLISFQIACYSAGFSFAVFGDNREEDAVLKDIIKAINKDASIEFALNTGDITFHGWGSEYEKYWQMCGSCRAKIYDTIGNHDVGLFNAGQNVFKKKYGETYYYFDFDGSRFIILDNAKSRGLGRKQFSWLKDALATKRKKFVFMHKPPFDPTGNYPNYLMTPKEESEA